MKPQGRRNMAVLGGVGSFSHTVAEKLAPGVTIVPKRSVEDIATCVARGDCTSGILPLENSIAGTIHETLDTILRHNLTITAETFLPISHHLLMAPDAGNNTKNRMRAVKTIFSHPKAFEQCQKFLEAMPRVRLVLCSDTAEAAGRVATGNNPAHAAIGSVQAAAANGLSVVKAHIEDQKSNVTRFVVVEKGETKPVDAEKASLMMTLPHVPGSLHRLLGCFAAHGLNLTKIESRPLPKKPWEYRFYIDVETGTRPETFAQALHEARSTAGVLQIIGMYKKGKTL